MASRIDPTKPTYGKAYTSDVRSNFSAAKTEIEALQKSVADVTVTAGGGAGDLLPVMDSVATVGVSDQFAREDHIHPSDTTKYDASNPLNFQTLNQLNATVAQYIPLTQKAANNGVATLDNTGRVPSAQLPTVSTGTLHYVNGWNASTNTPTMANGAMVGGSKAPSGNYYIVTVAGTTSVDGVNTWSAGDWILSNGTTWERVQVGTTPYLPLAGGSMTSGGVIAGLGGITFTTNESIGPIIAIVPDVAEYWADTNSNNAMFINKDGSVSIAALYGSVGADPTTPTGIASKQYVDALRGNTAPLPPGIASAGTSQTLARSDHVHPGSSSNVPIDSPVFTTQVTLGAETWVAYVNIPDVTFAYMDNVNGNIPLWILPDGTIGIANLVVNAINTPVLTGINSLNLDTITVNKATIANRQTEDELYPDLIDGIRGLGGNFIFGFDFLTGETNVVSLNALNDIKINGKSIQGSSGGSGTSVSSDAYDIRNPTYGGIGDGLVNTGLVTTTGNQLKLVNYHGNVTIAATADPSVWQITISNQRWDGFGFQPRHIGKNIYIESDDGAVKILATVKQHGSASSILITGTSISAQSNITASVTVPAFDTAMAVGAGATKYIVVDGMSKEIWNNYSATDGSALGGHNYDIVTPYGVHTFISQIATIASGNTITIKSIAGATPSNATFPMNWTSVSTLVQWGSNNMDAAAKCAKAAFEAGVKRIRFTGNGLHYLMLGACASGQWTPRHLTATTQDTSPLFNAVLWSSDNATIWLSNDGGARYFFCAPGDFAKPPTIPTKRIFGKLSLPRCAAKPFNQSLNVVISGDSLGSINPQSQVSLAMGVIRFQEEFQAQNPGRQCNFYCIGIGGATWASLADPGLVVTNTTPSVIYGTMPKPLASAIPHRNFYVNVNQTATSATAPIVPDVVAMFCNAGNDNQCIDAHSLQSLYNFIRNIPRADGYGPTDFIFQTDYFMVFQIWNTGTEGGVGNVQVPDPHTRHWWHDYSTTMNRNAAAVLGAGCVDYAEQIAKVFLGNDLTRRLLRQMPSQTWNLSPTAPVSFGPRCRDFYMWFTLPAANDAAGFTALTEISWQISSSPGNRAIARMGPNGNIWICATSYGHWVDTNVTCTAGSKTITVPSVSANAVSGTLTGKALQLNIWTGRVFTTADEGKCFVAPTGNLTSGVIGRRPQRNYIRRMMDANNVTVFDRAFDGGDVTLSNVNVSVGGQQFIAQDGEAMPHVAITYPDGTLFQSRVAYGGYVSSTQVTLVDNIPQSLDGSVAVSMFLGRMCVPWFDTGIKPDATNNLGAFEIGVSRGTMVFGYNPNLPLMPIIPTTVMKSVERFGAEFNCIIRSRGTQQVVASNMWIDEDIPNKTVVTPFEARGFFDANSADEHGGTAGHYGSRLRVEVLDPMYAIQNLSAA